jgi:hypothetical protein
LSTDISASLLTSPSPTPPSPASPSTSRPLTSASQTPSTTSGQQSSTSTANSPANTVFWGENKGVNLGCYVDRQIRLLSGPNFTDTTSMTPQLCAGLCSNYAYFGLEYGSQCFCGDVLTSGYPHTSYTDCNTTCPGDSSQLCGSVWHIEIYKLTISTPPIRSYNALGCYLDETTRIIQGPEYSNQWMTTELCAGLCNGYTYFGVEYSDQCFCGNGYSTYTQEPGTDCNYTCAGDSSQVCGGYYRINLYSFS